MSWQWTNLHVHWVLNNFDEQANSAGSKCGIQLLVCYTTTIFVIWYVPK